jgi:hypothetical protein
VRPGNAVDRRKTAASRKIDDMEKSSDEQAVNELTDMFTDPADVAAARELAEAERAVTQDAATEYQTAGVAAVAGLRRPEDRIRAWRGLPGR